MEGAAARDLEIAYRYCERLAWAHPENFFIGSILLPAGKRRHLAAVYAYARHADDLADGDLPAAAKLELLDRWEMELDRALAGSTEHPVFVALSETIRVCDLPVASLRDLLVAFRHDARFRPFATFAELRGYCRNSADPVGRLVLALFDVRDEERRRLSDSICTALQLVNFWQDLGRDIPKGRLYLPLDDLERFGVTRESLERGEDGPRLRECLRFQCARTRELFHQGLALAAKTEKRLAREVRMFAGGGLRVLDRIEKDGYRTLSKRPSLTKGDKLRLVWETLLRPAPTRLA